ncbi:oleosin-like [Syzygium oleosum]|uniref:oleosin-like n=1 Tax=Syzygium oleosum TaxID=219896 RepID=UPI0011D279A7|nr:oleosin-like [Syzygium oleosum]
MADLQVVPPRPSAAHGASVFHKLHEHAPGGSAHLLGFLALVVADAVLLLLIGLTITAAVVGLILLAPLVIVSSPVWVPIAAVLFVAVAAVLSACGFGVIALAGVSWLYKYFTGSDLSGVGRGANARTGHVKDYAGEAFAK